MVAKAGALSAQDLALTGYSMKEGKNWPGGGRFAVETACRVVLLADFEQVDLEW